MEATLIIFPRINQVQSHCYITTLTTWSAVGRLEETFIEPILKYHINQKAELERVPKEENNNIPHTIYLKNIVYDTYLPITIFSIQCELVSRLKTKKARPPPYLLPHATAVSKSLNWKSNVDIKTLIALPLPLTVWR